MVVWRQHGNDPPPEDRDHMLARLSEVATARDYWFLEPGTHQPFDGWGR